MNTLHLPVLGNGDGGAFTTADDVHRFWLALLDGRIVSRETVEEMTRPRHDVPEENMRYGMGFWLHRTHPALIMEGYDAGVSFRSTHLVDTRTTVSVLGNSSQGAWPVISALAPAIDAELGDLPSRPPAPTSTAVKADRPCHRPLAQLRRHDASVTGTQRGFSGSRRGWARCLGRSSREGHRSWTCRRSGAMVAS